MYIFSEKRIVDGETFKLKSKAILEPSWDDSWGLYVMWIATRRQWRRKSSGIMRHSGLVENVLIMGCFSPSGERKFEGSQGESEHCGRAPKDIVDEQETNSPAVARWKEKKPVGPH